VTSMSWRANAYTRHIIAIVASLMIFTLVFAYTGAADIWFAIGGGMGMALFFYYLDPLLRRAGRKKRNGIP